ncbi:GntR family transcriptional regulator [Kordiimonas sp.]|uniref:GntR family transcriptional regulator n=1 Tax=Kordiimonas sp. TaxID=1970157 RepID=UPI003A90CA92
MSNVKIQIVTGDARPIFKQIVDGIRMEIARGELPVGTKLPSVRGLAMQLMINANTVAKAYGELTAQGLVEPRQGLGLFVSEPRQLLSEEEQKKRLHTAVDTFVNEVAYLEFRTEDILKEVQDALTKLEGASSPNDRN